MEQLLRRIETSEVRVTNVGMQKDTFVYGSEDAPQYACTGVGALLVEYVDDKTAATAEAIREAERASGRLHHPIMDSYDRGLPDTDDSVQLYAPEDHAAWLRAQDVKKAIQALRAHADLLEDGTLTLDGFSLVKPAELVESAAGLARTFTGTGNLALAFHDASARAAHLAHAEVIVD